MAKYLIEVSHEDSKASCEHTARVFLSSGSHFITNADWGCLDGEHKAWIMIEADEKRAARNILPPAFRRNARVVELTKFSLEKLEQHKKIHH